MAIFMSEAWQLHRCDCGHSFGCNGSHSASCTRCGSSNSKVVSSFDDSRQLAKAVAQANLPNEISDEISKRISKLENINANRGSEDTSARTITIQAMHESTDDAGNLTLQSLERTLVEKGVSGTSAQHIIGQAELEGVLIRIDADSWSWL